MKEKYPITNKTYVTKKEEYDGEKEILRSSIANNIKEALKKKNISQQQLAQYIGIAESSITRSLYDKSSMKKARDFNIYELKCIADYLDITLEEIVTGISIDNKEEHIRTGLNNYAIKWLKSIRGEKEYLLEIVNLILGNEEIAEAMFESVYLYSVSPIPSTYFKKEGTVNERQAKFIADDELLLRYAIVGSFEEILKLIKKKYNKIPNNYYHREVDNKVNEICKSLGKKLRYISDKSFELDIEDKNNIIEID